MEINYTRCRGAIYLLSLFSKNIKPARSLGFPFPWLITRSINGMLLFFVAQGDEGCYDIWWKALCLSAKLKAPDFF